MIIIERLVHSFAWSIGSAIAKDRLRQRKHFGWYFDPPGGKNIAFSGVIVDFTYARNKCFPLEEEATSIILIGGVAKGGGVFGTPTYSLRQGFMNLFTHKLNWETSVCLSV